MSVDGDNKAFWFLGRKWSLELDRTDDNLGVQVYLRLAAGADAVVSATFYVKMRGKMQHAKALTRAIGGKDDGREFGVGDAWGFKSFATLADLQDKGCYEPKQDAKIVLGLALQVHKAAHEWWTEATTTPTSTDA